MTSEINEYSTKSPFNTYDIFGYLIPGSSFIVICLVFDVWISKTSYTNDLNKPFLTALDTILDSRIADNLTLSVLYIFLLIVAAYVLGHIIAGISGFTIDRLLTGKGYYYPVVSLTTPNSELDLNKDYKKLRVRGGFLLFNLIFIFFSFLISINGYFNLSSTFTPIISIGLIILMTLLLFLSFLYVTGRNKENGELNQGILLCSKIYNYIAERLGYFSGTRVKLSEHTVQNYKKFVERKFEITEIVNSDVYWYSYMYVASKSQKLTNHLLNWLHLYSYARNLSTALYLSSVYVWIIIGLNKFGSQDISAVSYFIFILLYVSSFIMLARYFYLYVTYYSKFLIRACVYLHMEKD